MHQLNSTEKLPARMETAVQFQAREGGLSLNRDAEVGGSLGFRLVADIRRMSAFDPLRTLAHTSMIAEWHTARVPNAMGVPHCDGCRRAHPADSRLPPRVGGSIAALLVIPGHDSRLNRDANGVGGGFYAQCL